MVKLKLNGESHECPSSYFEIKTRQYIRILKEWDQDKDIADRDYFKLFNIVTDGNFTDFARTVENEVTLTGTLGWVIYEDFKFSTIMPKVLNYKGKLVTIPGHPRELSIGQNIHLRRDYIDKSKILEENISIAVAIYLQPLIDDALFSIKRAEVIAKEIDEMPAYLIYPIGFFLLSRALKFGTRPEKTLPLIKISLTAKLKATWQGLRRYIS